MPTVMNPHRAHFATDRSGPQKICLGMGFAFIVIGLMGVILPGILGMHLSMLHNLIHILSGALALWCGFTAPNRAYNFCLGFGAVYGLLGIAGFVMGEPGYPAMGHMEADQNLFRIIPNFLEFGTMDHVVHLLIGSFLLFTAFTFRKDRKFYTRERSSSEYTVSELNRRSTLGESDYSVKNKNGEVQ